MKVTDTMYITIDGIVLSIHIDAYQNMAGKDADASLPPHETDYEESAAQFGSTLEKVREALLDLEERNEDTASRTNSEDDDGD